MKKFKSLYSGLLFLCSLFMVLPLLSQQHNHVHKQVQVKATLSSIEDQKAFQDLGVSTCDISQFDKDEIIFTIDDHQLQLLEKSSLNYQVLIEDVGKYYGDLFKKNKAKNKTAKKTLKTANGFGAGSLGNYYTYDEVVQKLDELSGQYGNIASQKINIGTSNDGHIIWAIKISDNPNSDENEPAVYYDALHHSNEYNSMATLMNYMFWLVENYNSDPRVKYIIDHREIYFVPVVNPDGYKSNEAHFLATGGPGGQRKNNRKINGIVKGVDLNRNYAQGYNIVYNCSSDNPDGHTFSGANAFSEPESRAVRDFTASINPKIALSCHAGALSYLMPYGYSLSEASDIPEFKMYSIWASDFLSNTGIPYSVTKIAIDYFSCGTTRSYFHSMGTYAWTPEVGSKFSSDLGKLYGIVDMHVEPYLYNALIAGSFADIKSHEIVESIVPGQNSSMKVSLVNKGVGQTATNVTVKLIPSDAAIPMPVPVSYGSIGVGAEKTLPVSITVPQGYTEDQFDVAIVVFQNGVETTRELITLHVGTRIELFKDKAEHGSNNWTFNGAGVEWGTTSDDSYSDDKSFCDSPGAFDKVFFEKNSINYFTSPTINLANSENPVVSFTAKWNFVEDSKVELQISSNSGQSWITLDSYVGCQKWKHFDYTIPSQFRSGSFKARFKLAANSFRADGFYFDDFQVVNYSAPLPVCTSPTNLATMNQLTPTSVRVRWDEEPVSFYRVSLREAGSGFQVYEASYNANEIDLIGLNPGTLYTVAVRATCLTGVKSDVVFLNFNTPNVCVPPQNLSATNLTDASATIQWDGDSAADTYRIQFRVVGTPTWFTISSSHNSTAKGLSGLSASTDYEWRIRANCANNNLSDWTRSTFRTQDSNQSGSCQIYNYTGFEGRDLGIWNDGGAGYPIRNAGYATTGDWSYRSYYSGRSARVFSDLINPNEKSVSLKFDFKTVAVGDSDRFFVQKRINDSGSWITVKTYTFGQDFTDLDQKSEQLIIQEAGINNSIRIRFQSSNSGGGSYYLDNVEVLFCDDNNPCTNNCGQLSCTNTVFNSCNYAESFESGFGLWKNNTEDDLDWNNKSGSTSSLGTGPNAAFVGDRYIYVESSTTNIGYPQKTAIIESPCIDVDGDVIGLIYYTHMFGNSMGALYLELSTDQQNWDVVQMIVGDQGNDWKVQQYIFPPAYYGQTILLRFRAVTGNSYRSDIAIDRFKVLCTDDLVSENHLKNKIPLNELGNVNIFPNPADQNIKITGLLKGVGNVNIRMINVSGAVVLSDHLDLKSTNLDVDYNISEFEPGLYYIQFIRGNETITKSLVVVPSE